ncbi:MAG: tetratricopeptide repeat protein [bacterium]
MSEDRIKQFEEVLAMDPDDPIVRYGLGQALMDADRHAEAIPHLREAIRVKADYSVCYHLLGLCLEKTDDPAGAREIYEQGIQAARKGGDLHVVNLIEERMRALDG